MAALKILSCRSWFRGLLGAEPIVGFNRTPEHGSPQVVMQQARSFGVTAIIIRGRN
jgi:hypothetical protein